jgi:hypothetical protein
MTTQELINKLQSLIAEKPERAGYNVYVGDNIIYDGHNPSSTTVDDIVQTVEII